MLFTRFLCPESLAACVLILCPGTKRGNCVAPFCARAQNEARSWAQNGGGHKTRVGRKSRNQKKDTSMQARLCARAQNGDRLSSSGVDLSCRAASASGKRFTCSNLVKCCSYFCTLCLSLLCCGDPTPATGVLTPSAATTGSAGSCAAASTAAHRARAARRRRWRRTGWCSAVT